MIPFCNYHSTLLFQVLRIHIYELDLFFCVQIANFVKSHIFSRRRPIDGWKYMIEELGPNSKKGRVLSNKFTASSDGPRSFDNEKGMVRREFVGNRQ